MKVRYEAQNGLRIKKGTFKYKGKRHQYFCMFEPCNKSGNDLWWSYKYKKWIKYSEWKNDGNISSACGDRINNLKKAIRHLKKHTEIPAGTIFSLRCRFKGKDIYITK